MNQPMTNAPPTHSRCICRGCCEVFSTVGNFDKHRKGFKCHDPASLGMEIKSGEAGTWWGMPGGFRPRKGESVPMYRRAGKKPTESTPESNGDES